MTFLLNKNKMFYIKIAIFNNKIELSNKFRTEKNYKNLINYEVFQIK
jgi:hypothetical protein